MVRGATMFGAAVLAIGVVGSAWAGDRKEVAQRAGCVITVGDREGDTDLVISTCQWAVPAAKIIEVVGAADTHDFLSSVTVSRKLPDGRIHQVHTASGIADREITLDFTSKTHADGSFKVSWTASAKQEPMGEDSVRIDRDDGSWHVFDNGDGTSKVVYSLRYDAGGKVPAFLVRSFQKSGIGDVMEEMKARVSR